MKLDARGDILWAAYRTFILFALVEEVCKFLLFKRVVRKTKCDYFWYDLTVFMTLVGTGFEILESFVYAFSMSPGQAIVRGVTMLHAVFGFITGYFYGKSIRTGKKRFFLLGFLLAYLFHGFYDFSLAPAVEEFFVFDFLAVNLELAGLAVLIVMIVFFKRRKAEEKYTLPLYAAEMTDDQVQEEQAVSASQSHFPDSAADPATEAQDDSRPRRIHPR